MADKVTIMVVKVDLECPSCHKKIKKILAKFREIRDQVYDVKKGTVTITVVCCNPEKIRDKLCCKGGKTIKGIEIKVPPKPKEEKPKDDKPKEDKPKGDKPKEEKPKEDKPKADKPKEDKPAAQKEAPLPVLVPVPGYPPCYPMGVCCGPCYGGGPCNCGHGLPVPCYDNYGYTRRWYYSRCDYYSEESLYPCTIL
ncbi:protein PYRICULARIA ORYZAE RESISTANCE 21-like isoform X2 [Diospyros lotus]|uniref:protein PYRICULARIA ORYZAE RESISTANCE 21-like isoform X2 n=1 Tax=Diospyros lotus TaxID=55363 RepID=UPI00225783AC|nr:protein PYRICULARIA ORYZAE RESISTANCE 21-like isoform X2 [Diospyros lotus]